MSESRGRMIAGAALLLLFMLARLAYAEQPAGMQPELVTVRPLPPHHITIGKITYSVELVKNVPPAGDATRFSGKTCDQSAMEHGWCSRERCIYLKTGRDLQQERVTLLHEIQHAMLGTQKSDEETTYHGFIYETSPKLLEVLQQNPALYRYLTAPAPAQAGSQ